jgi:hypothetical protein
MFILKSKKTGSYYQGNGLFTTDINKASVHSYDPINDTWKKFYELEKIEVYVKITPIKRYLLTWDDDLYYVGNDTWCSDKDKAVSYTEEEAKLIRFGLYANQRCHIFIRSC